MDILVNVIRKLQNEWENAREQRKNQPLTDNESEENPENHSEEEEEGDDSFIDDGEHSEQARRRPEPEPAEQM